MNLSLRFKRLFIIDEIVGEDLLSESVDVVK